MKEKKDEALIGNEKIEEYIGMLQQEPTEELLAVTLTSIRRRMQEKGQLIVGMDAPAGDQMKLQFVSIDGKNWLAAYTSFDEELKGGNSVMSTFMAEIGQILKMAYSEADIAGVALNPWNRTLILDKNLISVILGI